MKTIKKFKRKRLIYKNGYAWNGKHWYVTLYIFGITLGFRWIGIHKPLF